MYICTEKKIYDKGKKEKKRGKMRVRSEEEKGLLELGKINVYTKK